MVNYALIEQYKIGGILYFIRTQIILKLVNLKKIIICESVNTYLKNPEGIKKYMMNISNFQSSGKKNGFSGFARLRNSEDFLEIVIESHIEHLNEIILVDNNSSDNTRYICEKLKKKYPEKIKLFFYDPEVYRIGTEEYKECRFNSIHSFATFSNYALSKCSYKNIVKVDDDHLIIKDNFKENLKKMKNEKKRFFYTLPGINIVKTKTGYGIPKSRPFAGIEGDHGAFSLTERTYFCKMSNGESLLHPYFMKQGLICFLHLKYLKKNFGSNNYHGKLKNDILGIAKDNTNTYDLPKIYEEYLRDLNL